MTRLSSKTPTKPRPTKKPMMRTMCLLFSLFGRLRRGGRTGGSKAIGPAFLRFAVKHALGDAVGERPRLLELRDERQNDQEVREIVGRRKLTERDPGLFRRHDPAQAEK